MDARVARELAQKERSSAELEKLKLELADTLLATLQEIEWLRGSSRPAADKQIEYRDWALERARAEYELELKTNLGTSMAETQVAAVAPQTGGLSAGIGAGATGSIVWRQPAAC